MDSSTLALVGVVSVFFGLLAGWFLGKRSNDATKILDQLNFQLDETKKDLLEARQQYDAARVAAAKAEANLAARERTHQEKLDELRNAKEMLASQFSEVGQKLLNDAQEQFLKRADARFNQQTEKNEERIGKLLQPVGERLKAYEEQVSKIEKERTEAYGALHSLMNEMKSGQERVQAEAARIVNSLRNAPKARGRWGEQQLRNVLESCGLAEYTDFKMEQSIDSDEGRLRPDATVRIPGGKFLVIDAKVTLNHYQDAFNAADEDSRAACMSLHCQAMKSHLDNLSRKAYWDQFEDAPDYVIMFVPGEHFLAAALEHQPNLWDAAFAKRVLLATPTNLVAIARTVASVWRQEKVADEAKKIAALGKEMYDRLAVASEHAKKIGSGLSTIVGNYNKFVGSFERNVLSTGRKFKELNIETGKKEIEDLPEIEALPRYSDEFGAEENA